MSYVLSRLFLARAHAEIVSYSRTNSYPPPPTVDATRWPVRAGRISESLEKSAKHTPVNLNTLRQINMGPRRGSWSQTHSDRLTAIVCGARDRECGYGATAVCAVRRCMGGCDGSPTNSQHCCYCSPPMLNVNVLLLKSLLLTTLVFNNSSTVLTP